MRPVVTPFTVKAVGVSFRPDYPDSLLRLAEAYAALPLGVPGEASLVRDAANEHDPNAIAILTNGEHVGYLPRELAARIAPELDAGARFRVRGAEVLINPEHPDRPGLSIEVERVAATTPPGAQEATP